MAGMRKDRAPLPPGKGAASGRGGPFRLLMLALTVASAGPACRQRQEPPASEAHRGAEGRTERRALAGNSQGTVVAQPVTDGRLINRGRRCMGTLCELTAWHQDEALVEKAFEAAFAELARIEALMTTWDEASQVSRLNARAGQGSVSLDEETYLVLKRAQEIAHLSGGAFDVTVGAFKGLWKFDEDNDGSLPSPAAVATRKDLVNHRDLILKDDERSAQLKRTGQRITLGGIAKGYGVDGAARVLRQAGLKDFLVHAGGDLFASGRKGQRPWTVGIQDPRGARGRSFALMHLEDAAFSTSGDYERFIVRDGKRYHHILDPRTGQPAQGCRSVTIWAKDAMTADALDTAIFVMGPEKGRQLIESLPDVEGVIVDSKNQIYVSPGLRDRVKFIAEPSDGV